MAGLDSAAKRGSRRNNINSMNDDQILKQLPTRVMSSLMPFQREGVVFAVRKGGRCLIADEMGLGKTLQAIAVAYHYREEWPLLIIVPSSLRFAWIEELEKWLPDVLPGEINLIQGSFDTGGIAVAKITIVTYGLLSCKSSATVKEALKAQQFRIVICDESHYFKNSRTECCKAVTPLLTSAERCLLLSGTPALARPSELFTQLDALLPGKFGSFWSFTKKYCAAHWQHFGRRRQWKADGASNLDELQQRLTAIMIRREKNSVLTQLPPKQRQKILFPLKDSQTKKEILSTFAELKPLLKKSKSALAANLLGNDVNTANGGPEGVHAAEQTDTSILSRIQRLYNLTGDAKIGPAREYIQMLCENTSLKFLVFAYHHNMMNGLQQALWDKKVKFVRIDGQTKPSDRQLYVQQFQSDKDIRVAILSILAAGVGLTLTAASLVVFTELHWTPGVMVQCEDRAHRIGQTSAVPIHYLVARETMDEWVWSAVCRKILVTSTALTGKKQAMCADAGDSYQVKLLSAAEAYIPAEDTDIDISELIQSPLPRDQKSILDFFSSQSATSQDPPPSAGTPPNNRSQNSVLDLLDMEDSDSISTSTPVKKRNKTPFPIFTSLKQSSQSLCVISDGSDDEMMKTSPKHARVKRDTQLVDTTSRKRKCVTVDNQNVYSDSDFENISHGNPHSAKKKIKCNSDSKPRASTTRTLKSSSKKSFTERGLGKSTDIVHKEQSEAAENIKSDSTKKTHEHWACLACTFSNSSLLPFCEMCETPRKQKPLVKVQNPKDKATTEEPVTGKLSASQGNELELLPPLCSSTQITKLEPQKMSDENGIKVESLSEEENENTFCRHLTCVNPDKSKWRAKRCLLPGVDVSKDNVKCKQTETGQGERNSNTDSHGLSDDQSISTTQSTKSSDWNSHGLSMVELSGAESAEFVPVSFQLNSSMEKDDLLNSPCSSGSLDEEESTLMISNCDKEEQIDSSVPVDCDKAIDTTQSISSDQDSDNSKKSAVTALKLTVKIQSPENNKSAQDESESIAGKSADIECQSVSENVSKPLCDPHNCCPLHKCFLFSCSHYTGRVHIFDEHGQSLKANFLPLDVELDNISELPEVLHHPHHLRLVQNFVRQWNSLTDTKCRLISKRGLTFQNPLAAYDTVRTDLSNNKKRYHTKEDQAKAAMKTAKEVNGKIRVLSKKQSSASELSCPSEDDQSCAGNESTSKSMRNWSQGYVQALSADGTPLCLHCHQPCSSLVSKETLTSSDSAWHTRFCSKVCADAHWMKTNTAYIRSSVYDIQHGVCQLCGFDAHSFFCQIRDSTDRQQRAEKINLSKFSKLGAGQKKQMIARPYEGLFWHVDHIRPVWEGGGQCDIDNLRTLCTPCHVTVTSKQAAQRAHARKLSKAAVSGDITAFFKKI